MPRTPVSPISRQTVVTPYGSVIVDHNSVILEFKCSRYKIPMTMAMFEELVEQIKGQASGDDQPKARKSKKSKSVPDSDTAGSPGAGS